MTIQIKAPMVNVNEDEIELVEWHKEKNQMIKKGELLATFESTKSTYEFSSPDNGYFNPLVESGVTVEVGQLIGYLSDEEGALMDTPEPVEKESNPDLLTISWTRKARLVAERNQLDIKLIENSTDQTKITEQIILDFMRSQTSSTTTQTNRFNINGIERVLILGGGNVAALVIDTLSRVPHQNPVAILDDDPALQHSTILGVPVLGGFNKAQELFKAKAFDTAALAVGILPARKQIFEDLTAKEIPFTNIIDPSAIIGVNSRMGTGNMLMAFCRLGPEAVIGDNNFLSAYVNIEHHNLMGSHCTFGPSVYTSGGVQIGSTVKFGTGIHVEPRLTIGNNAVIASGVTITTNIPPNTVVKGKANFSF